MRADPNLAAEIRAMLRDVILAAGTKEPSALTFDGASSFMLWGAIIINANRSDGTLGVARCRRTKARPTCSLASAPKDRSWRIRPTK